MKKIDKSDLLVSSDYNSLYPIAMAQQDSKWPKIETAKSIKKEDSDRSCELLNSGAWKTLNKSGFLKTNYYNPKDIVFQHLGVKVTVFNEHKNRYGKINRFRNWHITQYLTSVDIEELVRVGSVILEFYEGFICDNLEFNHLQVSWLRWLKKEINLKKRKKIYYKVKQKRKQTLSMDFAWAEIYESYNCVSTH